MFRFMLPNPPLKVAIAATCPAQSAFFLSIVTRFHPFAGRVRPRLPGMAGWRGVLRYMAVSLFDADVCGRRVNVWMRVRIIFIVPPQHLQRIAGRGCGGGITTRLSSCTSGTSLLLGCKKPKLRARR